MTNNWPTKKLGEVCKIFGGGTPKRSRPEYWNGDIQWLTIKDINNRFYIESTKQFITQAGLEKSNAQIVPPKSVILSCTASVGNVAVNLMPLTTNQQFNSFVCNKNLIPEFLAFYLIFQRPRIQSLGGLTTFRFISKSLISNLRISIPPLSIQQKIVDRLDAIRKAQELNEKQLSLADELFQSLLYRELKQRKDWEVKKLGEVVKDLASGFASRPVGENKGIPQIRPHNIGSDGNETLNGIKFVPKTIKNLEKYFLEEGDVLFNNTNSIELVGKTAYVSQDYKIVFSNHITRIRVKEDTINSYFLSSFLNRIYHLGKFRSLCTPWVNQAGINNSMLKSLKIPLPPLKTQRQIVKKLSAVQGYKKKLLKQKELLIELFESTLDKAMKGKLVK